MIIHIDELRKQHNMTWQHLADTVGCDRNTLHVLSRGDAKMIRFDLLDALCTALQVPIDEVLTAEVVRLPMQRPRKDKDA